MMSIEVEFKYCKFVVDRKARNRQFSTREK